MLLLVLHCEQMAACVTEELTVLLIDVAILAVNRLVGMATALMR